MLFRTCSCDEMMSLLIMIVRHKICSLSIYIFTWKLICYIFDSLIFRSRIVYRIPNLAAAQKCGWEETGHSDGGEEGGAISNTLALSSQSPAGQAGSASEATGWDTDLLEPAACVLQLYRWPDEGWVRDTVVRRSRTAGFSQAEVVRYGARPYSTRWRSLRCSMGPGTAQSGVGCSSGARVSQASL